MTRSSFRSSSSSGAASSAWCQVTPSAGERRLIPTTSQPSRSSRRQTPARWAAEEIQTWETILLDACSTVGALAHELRRAELLTVATTGMTALQEPADVQSVHVECLGGTLRPLTEAAL